jgi:hypothetical protein
MQHKVLISGTMPDIPKEIWFIIFNYLHTRDFKLLDADFGAYLKDYDNNYRLQYQKDFPGDYAYRLNNYNRLPNLKWRKFYRETDALIKACEVKIEKLSEELSIVAEIATRLKAGEVDNLDIYTLLKTGLSNNNFANISCGILNYLFIPYHLKGQQNYLDTIFNLRKFPEIKKDEDANKFSKWAVICYQSLQKIEETLKANDYICRYPPIYEAINFNNYELVAEIVNQDFIKTENYYNGFIKAIHSQRLEIMRIFINNGADIYYKLKDYQTGLYLDQIAIASKNYPKTYLAFAVHCGFEKGVKLLLKSDATFNLLCPLEKRNILFEAIKRGSVTICKYLLKQKLMLNHYYLESKNKQYINFISLYQILIYLSDGLDWSKITIKQVRVLKFLIQKGLYCNSDNERTMEYLINCSENMPFYLGQFVVTIIIWQAGKHSYSLYLKDVLNEYIKRANIESQDNKDPFVLAKNKITERRNIEEKFDLKKLTKNDIEKEMSTIKAEKFSLNQVERTYGRNFRDMILNEYSASGLLNDYLKNYNNIFLYLKKKPDLMQLIAKFNQFIDAVAYQSQYFELFPLFYEKFFTLNEIKNITEVEFPVYCVISQNLTNFEKAHILKVKEFFATDYFKYLQQNVFSLLDDEILRLKNENGNDILKEKIDTLENAKSEWISIISFYLLNNRPDKIHFSLCHRVKELSENYYISYHHNDLQMYFKNILGILIAASLLFLPFLSKRYKNFFFETPTYCRMQEVNGNMQLAATAPCLSY